MAQGVDQYRVALLIAVLERRIGFNLVGNDVFINIAGGISIEEPAIDLAVITAIASSFRNVALDGQSAIFGEVGLAGEVRGVSAAGMRLREAAQMGFKRVVLPENNLRGLDPLNGLDVVGVRSVVEALEVLLE
jgi:DNA repair protein RadA/Sms